MVKHAETIRCLLPTNCFSLLDHFVGVVFKRLNRNLLTNLLCQLIDCFLYEEKMSANELTENFQNQEKHLSRSLFQYFRSCYFNKLETVNLQQKFK